MFVLFTLLNYLREKKKITRHSKTTIPGVLGLVQLNHLQHGGRVWLQTKLLDVFFYSSSQLTRTIKRIQQCTSPTSPQQFTTLKLTNQLVKNWPLQKRQGNWVELFFAKKSGTVTGKGKKTSQQLTSASPITIPETIAGRISAPVPFSFLKW